MASGMKDYSLFKVLTVGDSGVGKTCMIVRFADDQFFKEYVSTIGCDFRVKSIQIEDQKAKLQLWDTAGQERFRTITACYYRGADCVILAYDITSKESFINIDHWMNEFKKYPEHEDFLKILVGCKCDKEADRKTPKAEALKKAKENDMLYYETSALNNVGVKEMFEGIAKELLKKPKKTTEKVLNNGLNERKVKSPSCVC